MMTEKIKKAIKQLKVAGVVAIGFLLTFILQLYWVSFVLLLGSVGIVVYTVYPLLRTMEKVKELYKEYEKFEEIIEEPIIFSSNKQTNRKDVTNSVKK